MKIIRLISLLILTLSINVWSTNYYIRTDGLATKINAIGPSSNIKKCMTVATYNSSTFLAGDTCFISDKGGNYSAEFIPPSSGTSNNPIVLSNCPGEYPTIDLSVMVHTWIAYSGNTFKSTYSENPYICFYDSTMLKAGADKDHLLPGEWTWASNVLYLCRGAGVDTNKICAGRISSYYYAIAVSNKNYNTIRGIKITKCAYIALTVSQSKGINICNMVFKNNYQQIAIDLATGNFYNNIIDKTGDGNFTLQFNSGSIDTFNIYYNLFKDQRAYTINIGGSGLFNICNNTISMTTSSAIVVNNAKARVKINNNIFHAICYDGSGLLIDNINGNVSRSNNVILPMGVSPASPMFEGIMTAVKDTMDDVKFKHSKTLGFYTIGMDDWPSYPSFKQIVDSANILGIKCYLAINTNGGGDPITLADWQKLTTMTRAGHSICVHGNTHASWTDTTAMTIQYTGAEPCSLVISSNHLYTYVTGNPSRNLNIDLTTPPNDVLQDRNNPGLVSTINNTPYYTANIMTIYSTKTASRNLKIISKTDIKMSLYPIQFDLSKYLAYEIDTCKKIIMTNTGYTPKIGVYPSGYENFSVWNALKRTGLTMARGVNNSGWNFDSIRTYADPVVGNPDTINTLLKPQAISIMDKCAYGGGRVSFMFHGFGGSGYDAAHLSKLMRILKNYSGSCYNISYDSLASYIYLHGINVTGDSLLWKITKIDSSDYRLKSDSPARKWGDTTFVSGIPNLFDLKGVRITNSSGHVLYDAISVGAYQYSSMIISAQPQSVSTVTGQTATFNITASNVLNYSWWKKPLNGSWTLISNATSLSYTTPALSISDNGSYFKVALGNTSDTIFSDSAQLTVTSNTPPSVTLNGYTWPSYLYQDQFEMGDLFNYQKSNDSIAGVCDFGGTIALDSAIYHSGRASVKFTLPNNSEAKACYLVSSYKAVDSLFYQMWFYLGPEYTQGKFSTTGDYAVIFAPATSAEGDLLHYSLIKDDNNNLVVAINHFSNIYAQSIIPITTGQWHCFTTKCVTGESGAAYVYIDGVPHCSSKGLNITPTPYKFVIGFDYVPSHPSISGAMYVDDVLISHDSIPTCSSKFTLYSPDLRGRIGATVKCIAYGTNSSDSIIAVLTNAQSFSRNLMKVKGPFTNLNIPADLSNLDSGVYKLKVSLRNSSQTKYMDSIVFVKSYNGNPIFSIDINNNFVKNGVKIFPIASFGLHCNEFMTWKNNHYANILYSLDWPSDPIFGGMGEWRYYLDSAKNCGLDVIGPVHDTRFDTDVPNPPKYGSLDIKQYVDSLSSRSNNAWWLFREEPDNWGYSADTVKLWWDIIKTYSPSKLHENLLMGESYLYGEGARSDQKTYSYPYLVSDIISSDIYPTENYSRGVTYLEFIKGQDRAINWNMGLMPFLPNIQTVDVTTGEYGGTPTPNEIKLMCWLSIIHGAKGIHWYPYSGDCPPENYTFMTSFNDDVDRLKEMFLSDSTVYIPVITTDTGRVDILSKVYNGKTYIFAANPKKNSCTATFNIGSTKHIDVYNENRTISMATSTSFKDIFNSLGVHIYILNDSTVIIPPPSLTYRWQGKISTDALDSNNYFPKHVPLVTDTLVLDSGAVDWVLPSPMSVGKLEITRGYTGRIYCKYLLFY